MKRRSILLCLAVLLCLMLPGTASAETKLFDPAAIIHYDRTLLADWTPSYNLTMPGVLLELTHAEAMLTVSAVEKAGLTPAEYLSHQLDRAAETLSVSDAQIAAWPEAPESGGQTLIYSYTYPEGDEVHLIRSCVFARENMLIDLTVDTWGEEARLLMDTAQSALTGGGFTLTLHEQVSELTALLSDVIGQEDGLTAVLLTEPEAEQALAGTYYPLSPEAAVLFPNPDDPSLLYPVAPDFSSLADAILTYEDSSDSPAMFYTLIDQGQIVYMEFSLMQ